MTTDQPRDPRAEPQGVGCSLGELRERPRWRSPDCATAVAAGDPYRLAILDYQMPEMDGIDLARAIRRDPALDGVRLVLLTSSARPGDTQVLRRRPASRVPDQAGAYRGPLRLPRHPARTSSEDEASAGHDRERPILLHRGVRQPMRARLLVVDDNPVNQRVVAAHAREDGPHRRRRRQRCRRARGARPRSGTTRSSWTARCRRWTASRRRARSAGAKVRTGTRSIIAMTAGAMAGDAGEVPGRRHGRVPQQAGEGRQARGDGRAVDRSRARVTTGSRAAWNPSAGLLDQTYVEGSARARRRRVRQARPALPQGRCRLASTVFATAQATRRHQAPW